MNKKLGIAILPLVILLVASGCESKKEGAAPQNTGGPMAVDVAIVKPRQLDHTITTSGTLIPNEKVEVKAQVDGRILSIGFEEGQKVEKGQRLLHVDDREWKAQLQRLEVQRDLAEKDVERKKALREVDGVSQELLDQAESNLASINASINEIKVQIDHATITAPFSGRIGLRSVSAGEFISKGQSVAILVQNDPIKLEFEVAEKYSYQLQDGQEVSFRVEGQKDTFQAKMYAFEPQVDPSSRAITIRARADNKNEILIPGTFADVTLTLEKLNEALMVPTESVIQQIRGQTVFLMKHGKVEKSEVEMGIRTGSAVQLTSGIQPGDTVLTTGLLQVQPGMPVKVRDIIEVKLTAE